MYWHPDSDNLAEGESRHTDKFHRCLGHVRAGNTHRGKSYNPYAVCTASIGYAGSYTKGHRGGARTPAGRDRKVASGAVSPAREPRRRGVHWRPTTQRVYTEDLAKYRRRS
jgi:hypothetical protein